jgi:hypothetical protein
MAHQAAAARELVASALLASLCCPQQVQPLIPLTKKVLDVLGLMLVPQQPTELPTAPRLPVTLRSRS